MAEGGGRTGWTVQQETLRGRRAVAQGGWTGSHSSCAGDTMKALRNWAGFAALALAATPALADVKAGADAWSRGDYPAAIAQWQGPAAAGDPDAQFNLGQAYRLGRGVQRDLARAEELFGKAAAQGHVQAADNYGLLMFDRGARAQAMPYVKAASDRGDPRAQYLMGIAHFNGDLAAKDWVRAYALMTLAQASGLPQAGPAIQQMDGYIPLPDRQKAAGLAQQIAQAADTTRAAQIAANDLGGVTAAPAAPAPRPTPASTPPSPPPSIGMPHALPNLSAPPVQPTPNGPLTAGADYARPQTPAAPPAAAPAPRPPVPSIGMPHALPNLSSPAPSPAPAPTHAAAPVTPPATRPAVTAAPKPAVAAAPKPAPAPVPQGGAWRVQLGAFGVAANADALWARVAGRPELAGHGRINVRAGAVTKLQAGGFASQGAAATACSALSRAGYSCLPARD